MPLYEYEEGTSRKFYRVDLDGRRVVLHWGRIGTEGQHQILSYETEREAKAEFERQCDKRERDRHYSKVVDEGIPHDPEVVSRERLAKAEPLSDSPRFLFVKKRKFAWVEARGNTLLSVQGARVDEDKLRPTTKAFDSPIAAMRARDAMVAELLAGGYELETFGKSERPAPRTKQATKLVDCSQLETVIERDPYDEAPWAVLEDFLLEREEDVRAELIRLDKAKQRGQEAQARGVCLPILLGKKHESLSRALIAPTWRAGYLVDTRIELGRSIKTTLAAFFAAPAARLLRELEIKLPEIKSTEEMCSVIAQAPCARVLRRLTFFNQTTGDRLEQPTLECEMLSGTELVELDSGQLPIRGASTLTTLARLRTRATSRRELQQALDGTLPALQLLALDVRPLQYWVAASKKWTSEILVALERVANGDFAPRLATVSIVAGSAADAVRELLEGGAVTGSCELRIS